MIQWQKLERLRVAAAGSFALEYALAGFGDPRQLKGRQAMAGYFDVLGVPMVAGRNFTRAEEKPFAVSVRTSVCTCTEASSTLAGSSSILLAPRPCAYALRPARLRPPSRSKTGRNC